MNPSFLFEIFRERDYRVKKYKLSEIFELPVSGEWGKEIGKEEHENIVKVIRTTNFTNIGKLDYNDIVLRNVEKSKVDKKKLIYGDIILEKSGGTNINPVGRVVYFDKKDMENDYITNNFTSILRVKEKNINSKYLLYYLLFNYKCGGISKYYNKTTGIQNLQVSKFLENTYFNIPSIETQNEVVNIIEKIQKIIQKKIKQLKKSEELKKSLFYEMFGDPIRNEKGWEVKKLKNISYVNDKKKILTPKEKYWLLNLEEIEAGSGRIILKKRIKYEDLPSSISYFDKNWILYSKLRPYLNKVVLSDEEGFCTSELIALRPNLEYLTDVFLWKYLMNNTILEYLKIHVSGAKMPRVVMEDFKNLKVVIPPLELQQKFSERIRDIDKLKFTEISSNKSCILLRKTVK